MLFVEGVQGKASGNQSISRTRRAIAESSAKSLELQWFTLKHVGRKLRVHQHKPSKSNKVDLAIPDVILANVRQPLLKIGIP